MLAIARRRAIDRVPPANCLDALLAVIYLIFNEGYVATRGDDLIRRELVAVAARLGRVLVSLLPSSAESRGPLAPKYAPTPKHYITK